MTDETLVEILKLVRVLAESAPWLIGLLVAVIGVAAALFIGNNRTRARDIGESIDRILDSVDRSEERVDHIAERTDAAEERIDAAQTGIHTAQELIEKIRARNNGMDNPDRVN
jgi:hypothetical protein